MGKRQSKQITHSLTTVISEQCILKEHIKKIVKSLIRYKKYINIQYLANDSFSLVVEAYNKDLGQQVALRVFSGSFQNDRTSFSLDKSECSQFSTLEVTEKSIIISKFPLILKRRLFHVTQKTNFYVEEIVYDKYRECLKIRCFQETQSLYLIEDKKICNQFLSCKSSQKKIITRFQLYKDNTSKSFFELMEFTISFIDGIKLDQRNYKIWDQKYQSALICQNQTSIYSKIPQFLILGLFHSIQIQIAITPQLLLIYSSFQTNQPNAQC